RRVVDESSILGTTFREKLQKGYLVFLDGKLKSLQCVAIGVDRYSSGRQAPGRGVPSQHVPPRVVDSTKDLMRLYRPHGGNSPLSPSLIVRATVLRSENRSSATAVQHTRRAAYRIHHRARQFRRRRVLQLRELRYDPAPNHRVGRRGGAI